MEIEVVPADERAERSTVTVRDDDGSSSTHHVTVSDASWERFGGAWATRAALVEASFWFLLEREPKESILRAFELSVIARYFPEYPGSIAARP